MSFDLEIRACVVYIGDIENAFTNDKMNPMDYLRFLLSMQGQGRPPVQRPPVMDTFLYVLLPFSIVPPVMLLIAGHFHPAAFLIVAPEQTWHEVALAFFAAELLTVPLMAWVMQDLSAMLKIEGDFRIAFLLAAVSVVPLWLSSLALAIPNVGLLLVVVAAGFLASGIILYRSLRSAYRIRDEEDAQALTSTAISVAGLLWAVLCGAVVLPLAA